MLQSSLHPTVMMATACSPTAEGAIVMQAHNAALDVDGRPRVRRAAVLASPAWCEPAACKRVKAAALSPGAPFTATGAASFDLWLNGGNQSPLSSASSCSSASSASPELSPRLPFPLSLYRRSSLPAAVPAAASSSFADAVMSRPVLQLCLSASAPSSAPAFPHFRQLSVPSFASAASSPLSRCGLPQSARSVVDLTARLAQHPAVRLIQMKQRAAEEAGRDDGSDSGEEEEEEAELAARVRSGAEERSSRSSSPLPALSPSRSDDSEDGSGALPALDGRPAFLSSDSALQLHRSPSFFSALPPACSTSSSSSSSFSPASPSFMQLPAPHLLPSLALSAALLDEEELEAGSGSGQVAEGGCMGEDEPWVSYLNLGDTRPAY